MRFSQQLKRAALATTLAAVFAAPAFADLPLPMPMHRGAVTYITGGFGLREQHALEAGAHNYNLAITNANKAGEFTADTALTIRTKSGRDVLRVGDTGPLFYAKLQPGDYHIVATNGGVRRVRNVNIPGRGSADLHLIWPQMG